MQTDEEESLSLEAQAAVGAVGAHIRKVAATASAEAQLSATSIVAMAAAALMSLLLVTSAWLCLVAAGVWLAVAYGIPIATAFLVAALLNLAVVLLLVVWGKGLLRNIGFSRTLQLVFPGSR